MNLFFLSFKDILKKSPKRESKYYELCNRRRKDVRERGRYYVFKLIFFLIKLFTLK